MNITRQKPPLSWSLIGAFLIVSAIVIILGLKYINGQKVHLINDKNDELKAIADLKVGQISQWRHERMGDAVLIQNDLSLIDQVDNFLNKTDNRKEEKVLLRWMNSIIDNYNYYRGAITDSRGRVKLSIPAGDTVIGPFLSPMIPGAFENQKIKLTDLHKVNPNGVIHIDLVIPLVKKEGTDSSAIGLIILRIDPRDILFPLIQLWPTKSKTSETLLLRQEGDSVIYLNELLHTPNSALSLKKSISQKNFIGALAVNGFEGTAEGVDYRNVQVLAAIKKVPESPWYMVSKVDMDEIDSQFSGQQNLARLLIIFFVSAFGAIIGWTIWHQRVRFYRQRYEAELEKLALRTHFDYILKYANDIVLLIDSDLHIVEVNDHALEVYQYSRDDLIGMDINKLRLPELSSQLNENLRILKDIGSLTYETIHRRKDGTTFPVEISARLFEIEGVKYYQSIGRDISERKRIEESLVKLLERYNLATQAAKLSVWEWNVTNDQLIWDDGIYELYGVKREEFPPVYENWLKLLHPQDVEKANNDIKMAISGETEYNTEFRIFNCDGSVKYIKAFGQVVRSDKGSPVRMIGINYDITGIRLAENSIIENEERFRKIFEESPFSIAMSGRDYRFIKVNSAFCRMMGYNEEEIISMTFRNFTHPDYIRKDDEFLQLVIGGKIPIYRTEKRYIRKDKSIIWGSTSVNPIFDSNGQVQYMLVMIEDITSRKNSEFELEKSLSLVKATIESTDDGLLVVDTSGKIVLHNQRFAEIWNIPQEVLDKQDDNLAISFVLDQLKEPDAFLSNVKHLYASPELVTNDILEFKDGRVFERYSQPQKINNLTVGRVWSFRDVTQEKIYEGQLIKAKEKAEESDRLKTAFLHNISHEIRTPMNAIVGFTALLDEPETDNESRRQFINIISQSTNQLLSIISDIVDISNIETNQVKLTLSKVNINSVVKSLFEQFTLLANQHKLLFRYETKLPDEKAFITTDNTKLIQIISNLLSNAFKFTSQGTVQFGYRTAGENIEFFVKDTGIGISEEKHSRIFDRFYQVENQSSRQYTGAGLGLSICKAYVEFLGGTIWLKSKPDKGSEFCFTLPYTN